MAADEVLYFLLQISGSP